MDILEIVFYIHGVSADARGRPHTDEYGRLHTGIARAAGHTSLWPTEYGGAEWGWNFDGGIEKGHKALAVAQRHFGGQVLPLVEEHVDPTLDPRAAMRVALGFLRPVIFNGFGDMFYYVSQEGKWEVRYEVGRQLTKHIEKRRPKNTDVSLTLVGHSAGSVVAFDILFYLFSEKAAPWGRRRAGSELGKLRKLARSNRLRLRRLITFGSPISFLMFRNNWMVETLAKGESLSPEQHGLTSSLRGSKDAGKALQGARWINLWDKDDPIAWPVQPVMKSPLVEDVYMDVGDYAGTVHDKYWGAKSCHKAIARRW